MLVFGEGVPQMIEATVYAHQHCSEARVREARARNEKEIVWICTYVGVGGVQCVRGCMRGDWAGEREVGVAVRWLCLRDPAVAGAATYTRYVVQTSA